RGRDAADRERRTDRHRQREAVGRMREHARRESPRGTRGKIPHRGVHAPDVVPEGTGSRRDVGGRRLTRLASKDRQDRPDRMQARDAIATAHCLALPRGTSRKVMKHRMAVIATLRRTAPPIHLDPPRRVDYCRPGLPPPEMKTVEVRHPLVQHKIGLLRDASLSTKDFRELVTELGTLLAYEATADLETEEVVQQGWAGPVTVPRIAGDKINLVPILRAGMGMLHGVAALIREA